MNDKLTHAGLEASTSMVASSNGRETSELSAELPMEIRTA